MTPDKPEISPAGDEGQGGLTKALIFLKIPPLTGNHLSPRASIKACLAWLRFQPYFRLQDPLPKSTAMFRSTTMVKLKLAAILVTAGTNLTCHAELVVYYPFEESLPGAGFNAYVGGSDFDLTAFGGSGGASISSVETKFGSSSASFSRDQSQYLFTDSGSGNMLEQGSSFSYSAWYYLDVADITGSDRYFVMESTQNDTVGGSQSHPISLGLRDISNEDVAQVYTSVGNISDQHYEFSSPTQEWVNVITTYDSTTDTLDSYINGTLVTRIASDNEQAGTLIDAGNGLVIGGHRAGTGRNFEGYIDDVAIWDEVISSSEIARIQNEPVRALPGSINAIPEPSGVLGLALMIAGSVLFRRRREVQGQVKPGAVS